MLPSVHRREECLHHLSQFYGSAAGANPGMPPPESHARKILDAITVADDCFSGALLAEQQAITANRLFALVLASVHSQLVHATDARAQAAAMAHVPEALVRSVINFATFVIQAGAPDLFGASKDLGQSMQVRTASCVALTFPFCMHRFALMALVGAPVKLHLTLRPQSVNGGKAMAIDRASSYSISLPCLPQSRQDTIQASCSAGTGGNIEGACH